MLTSSGLTHSSLGNSWWVMESCSILVSSRPSGFGCMYLHSAAETEDAVVCLLGSEALESLLDDIVLFGDQVIGPAKQLALAHCPKTPDTQRKTSRVCS